MYVKTVFMFHFLYIKYKFLVRLCCVDVIKKGFISILKLQDICRRHIYVVVTVYKFQLINIYSLLESNPRYVANKA